jgi:hypothetical protein
LAVAAIREVVAAGGVQVCFASMVPLPSSDAECAASGITGKRSTGRGATT